MKRLLFDSSPIEKRGCVAHSNSIIRTDYYYNTTTTTFSHNTPFTFFSFNTNKISIIKHVINIFINYYYYLLLIISHVVVVITYHIFLHY